MLCKCGSAPLFLSSHLPSSPCNKSKSPIAVFFNVKWGHGMVSPLRKKLIRDGLTQQIPRNMKTCLRTWLGNKKSHKQKTMLQIQMWSVQK